MKMVSVEWTVSLLCVRQYVRQWGNLLVSGAASVARGGLGGDGRKEAQVLRVRKSGRTEQRGEE